MRLCTAIAATLIAVLGVQTGSGQEQPAAEWPCYHGARRDNMSAEAGLMPAWPESGPKLLWEFEFGNQRNNNATDVLVRDGLVFASSGYGKGSVLLRPARQEDGAFTVEQVWATDLLDNHHGGVVLLDRRVYGAGHQAKGWFCLDVDTGTQIWQHPGKGSLTYADGRLYCLDERGGMSLVRTGADQWDDAVGAFDVPKGGPGLYWAHPVVCDGRLYVRHADVMYAYDIAAR